MSNHRIQNYLQRDVRVSNQRVRVVPEEPVVAVQVGAEGEDLAPGWRPPGIDGIGGQHGQAVPVRGGVGLLVPRGGRQQAAEGPPPCAADRSALVGEGDDGEAGPVPGDEVVSGSSLEGQAPAAAEGVSAAEEEDAEVW